MVLARGDRKGIEQLGQYLARCPFSLSRLVRITEEGKVLYKAEKEHCQEYPEPASDDLGNTGGGGGVNSPNNNAGDGPDILFGRGRLNMWKAMLSVANEGLAAQPFRPAAADSPK